MVDLVKINGAPCEKPSGVSYGRAALWAVFIGLTGFWPGVVIAAATEGVIAAIK